MVAEAITILLLLCAASVSFLRQQRISNFQAALPLGIMPAVTLLLHTGILKMTHHIESWNILVYSFYSAAGLLTVLGIVLVCIHMNQVSHRIWYAVIVGIFNTILAAVFIGANII